MDNRIDNSALLKAIKDCSAENGRLVEMYKSTIALLFLSAVLNVALLAGWIWELHQ